MSKIVHFGKYYHPERGGIESVTASLAEGAVRAGNDVSVVCFRSGNTQDSFINGVQILRSPFSFSITSQPLSVDYIKLCLKEARHADLIHMHYPNVLASLACLLAPRHTRVVVHWHSDIVGKGWMGRTVTFFDRILLQHADRIVATSSVYADSSKALAPFMSKVSIVPIGVSDPTERVDHILSPSWIKRLRGRRLILSVGRLVPYKGFETLITAALQMPEDIAIVIVGSGMLHDKLRGMIDASGLADRVYLAGSLAESELSALFRNADLYCMTSCERSEAFGVVLLEAMAYGLPIVATEIHGSGVPWVNKHNFSGLNVPVNNPSLLADACLAILSSKEKQTSFAKASRLRYLTEFTEELAIRRILSIYAEVLA